MSGSPLHYKQNRLKQLRAFCHVTQCGSISKAAEKLFSSQPAVSLQIQALERELECVLFERRGPRIKITPDGEVLYRLALPLVEGIDGLAESFAAHRGQLDRGELNIAAGESTILYILPDLIRRFTEGNWFVDLPQADELRALWTMYFAKYELSEDVPKAAEGYSGADVRNVCRAAWRDELPLGEIMASYVPASFSQKERIEALRRTAAGAYRSASYAGAYKLPTTDAPSAKKGRKINLK